MRIQLILAIACCASSLPAQTPLSSVIGPFTRPPTGNPVIAPNPDRRLPIRFSRHPFIGKRCTRSIPRPLCARARSTCSIAPKIIPARWRSAAILLGWGWRRAQDGIHFKRSAAPVFFPGNDGQKEREWPGGVEDPRIVESEDGTYVLTYTQWNRDTYSVGIATSRI